MSDPQTAKTHHSNPEEAKRERQARHALNNAAQGEGFLRSSLATEASRARDHMMAGEADPKDPIEIWAKRTGRFISLALLIGLAIYLVMTYVI